MSDPTGKRCTKCGETKQPEEFHRDRTKPDGWSYQCKACCCERARRWREANPERHREKTRKWEKANPERVRELQRRWAADNPEAIREASRRWREAHPEAAPHWGTISPEENREVSRRRHAANREAVLDHYGRSCACCGTVKRLGIDHVNGDGKEHRAQIGMGSSHLYRWLIANGFPGGFQVLCGWCNKSKADGDRCQLDRQAPVPDDIALAHARTDAPSIVAADHGHITPERV
jgi:hypothetical protein